MVRPRALFEHPRLGRALARAFDDAGDQALFDRARRVGYDVRTVDRAVMAWSARTTWSAGVGAFDTRRIETMLWERLLPPRGRVERDGVIRVEGALGREPVSLAVWNACAFVAYGEGPTSARANELALRGREGAADDDTLLRWHGATIPVAVQTRAPETLLEGVHDVELIADVVEGGVVVVLRVEGALPIDAVARVQRALAVFREGPLGESIGARRWASAERARIEVVDNTLVLRAVVPWVALDAIADVLRGRVGDAPSERGSGANVLQF